MQCQKQLEIVRLQPSHPSPTSYPRPSPLYSPPIPFHPSLPLPHHILNDEGRNILPTGSYQDLLDPVGQVGEDDDINHIDDDDDTDDPDDTAAPADLPVMV